MHNALQNALIKGKRLPNTINRDFAREECGVERYHFPAESRNAGPCGSKVVATKKIIKATKNSALQMVSGKWFCVLSGVILISGVYFLFF